MDTNEAVGTVVHKPTRDEIRAKIFSAKPESVILEDFYGVTVEIRQPSLDVILEKRRDDQKEQAFAMLTDYTYVPGTNEKVFDPEDVDSIRALPFGKAMQEFLKKVNVLLGVDPVELEAKMKDAMKSS